MATSRLSRVRSLADNLPEVGKNLTRKIRHQELAPLQSAVFQPFRLLAQPPLLCLNKAQCIALEKRQRKNNDFMKLNSVPSPRFPNLTITTDLKRVPVVDDDADMLSFLATVLRKPFTPDEPVAAVQHVVPLQRVAPVSIHHREAPAAESMSANQQRFAGLNE